MDEEQQDDIPPRMVELDEIQQQAQAAREQPAAEPALADAPEGGVVSAPLIEVTDDPPEEAVTVQFSLPDDTEGQDQKFAEIVQDVGQQAAVAQAAVPAPANPAPQAQEEEQFVQPERNPGERYIAFRNRSREAKKEFASKQWRKKLDAMYAAERNRVPIAQINQQAQAAQAADPPPQQQPAQAADPPAQVQAPLVPAAEIAQQAQAAREEDAPPGNVARGAGPAAAPGGKVPLDLGPQDIERLTREGEDTAEQLVERFRAFIEQTRTFNRSLLSMLDSVTAAMAQDHALLEQIRSRFERTREG